MSLSHSAAMAPIILPHPDGAMEASGLCGAAESPPVYKLGGSGPGREPTAELQHQWCDVAAKHLVRLQYGSEDGGDDGCTGVGRGAPCPED